MVQTWLVVCCHQCKKFQVDQEKKAKRWQCKVCGEKQSLQRVYARSHSAKDCRQVVQQYNTARGAVEAEEMGQALAEAYGEAAAEEECGGGYGEAGGQAQWNGWDTSEHAVQPSLQHKQQQQQRWKEFAEEGEEEDGWTVAVPERAVKQKRGEGCAHGQPSSSAGGPKRRRRQEQEAAGAEVKPAWGGEPDHGFGWHSAQQGHHQQQQQQQQRPAPAAVAGAQQFQQWPAQQRPLGPLNGAALRTGHIPGWQDAQKHCGEQRPAAAPRQPQPSWQQQGQPQLQQSWQPPRQQNAQPQLPWQRQIPPQPQQQRQHKQPLPSSGWRPQLPQPSRQEQAQEELAPPGQQADAGAAVGKWGGFVNEDDW